MWLNPEGSGTAGSFYYKLEFVNLSGRTCTLAGYPGRVGSELERAPDRGLGEA